MAKFRMSLTANSSKGLCVDLEELKLWHGNKADREWKEMGSKRKHKNLVARH